jgi:gliding motility-associated-like protein
MKKFLIIITFLSLSSTVFAQLSNRHWIPPLHARVDNLVNQHLLYLSTPVETPFSVTITTGDGTQIPGSPFTISRGAPVSVLIGNSQPSNMFVGINDVNTILNNKGLILEATEDFYASFRVRSANHAEILVSKGKTALGTSFRLGSVPQQYDSSIRNFVSSFMATENNTSVTISDYDTNVVFTSTAGNIESDTQTFILNKGQSVVVSGHTTFPANRTGFIGALVTSSKPIVVNTGNATGGTGPDPGNGSSGQDFNLDQIVGYENVGNEYVVVRGNGSPSSETPLVIATEDNTEIYINGALLPNVTINAGDYYIVPSASYTGAGNNRNIYIKSTKPIYVYQILAGNLNDATSGLNFIPPLSCYWQKSVDMIPQFNSIGSFTYNDSEIILVTETGSSITINGNPTAATSQPVQGNAGWETYRIAGLSGNIVVESTGALAVGVFGSDNNAAGFGGYYSGFGSKPRDTFVDVCSNNPINLFDAIEGNPIAGGTWSPSLSSGSDIFNPGIDPEGVYEYAFDITCDGLTLRETVSITVIIEQAPNAGISTSKSFCTSDLPEDLFTLLGANVTLGGGWSVDGVTRLNGVVDPSVDSSGVYTYTVLGSLTCSFSTASIDVTILNFPNITSITDFSVCDDNLPSDTDGESYFNLLAKTNEITNGDTNLSVKYYTNEFDANIDATNNINNVRAFSNTPVYFRATNEFGCFRIGSFLLIVNSLPDTFPIITLKQCDTDTDAITDFNLTESNQIITTAPEIYSFSFHNSEIGAINNTAIISNNLEYTAADGSVVWARIENEFGCFRTARINLAVSTTIIPTNHVFVIEECDNFIDENDPSNDGFAYFNFADSNASENAISNLLSFFSTTQQLNVTFYENEIDALIEANAIVDITNYRNTTANSQIIWARIDSENNNECFGIGPYVRLIVNPIPEVNLGENFTLCLDPTTGLGSQIINATPSTPGNYNYIWNPTNPNGNSPFYDVTQEGIYSVIVTNNITGCINSDSIFANFSSEPAIFSAAVATPAFSSGSTTIVAMASGGFGEYEYSLNLVDWQSSNIFTDLPNGSYVVYVRDLQGCGLLNSGTLFALTYPNFFTPNGDGYHDTWNIANLDPSYEAKIFIYDRYGKLIRGINPYGEGWDGTSAGQQLPATDYWFRIEYLENGTSKEFKSHFSLIR